jgi:hypothetical protein
MIISEKQYREDNNESYVAKEYCHYDSYHTGNKHN